MAPAAVSEQKTRKNQLRFHSRTPQISAATSPARPTVGIASTKGRVSCFVICITARAAVIAPCAPADSPANTCRHPVIREARNTSRTVTVNGRACDTAELSAVLRQMEAMGLLADGQIVADWQIEVTDKAETADELETPPAVKVLGRGVDAAALQEVTDFLDEYGLLTETGCLADWGLTQPGGSRPSDLTELLAMVEDESADRSMVITVDGTPITLGDFETMMEIEAEIKRIRD